MFQSDGAVPLLEDEDDDPERRGEREEVEHHALIASTGERNARVAGSASGAGQPEDVREAAEQRMQEVAVDRREAGERAVRAFRLRSRGR